MQKGVNDSVDSPRRRVGVLSGVDHRPKLRLATTVAIVAATLLAVVGKAQAAEPFGRGFDGGDLANGALVLPHDRGTEETSSSQSESIPSPVRRAVGNFDGRSVGGAIVFPEQDRPAASAEDRGVRFEPWRPGKRRAETINPEPARLDVRDIKLTAATRADQGDGKPAMDYSEVPATGCQPVAKKAAASSHRAFAPFSRPRIEESTRWSPYLGGGKSVY